MECVHIGTKKILLYHHSLHPWEYFTQKNFVPMCTHSMEFDSFYRVGIYRGPCILMNFLLFQLFCCGIDTNVTNGRPWESWFTNKRINSGPADKKVQIQNSICCQGILEI